MSPLKKSKKKNLMKRMPIKDEELIRLIRSGLTTIDGLWFLEVEDKFGFNDAFDIDLKVWKRYGPIIINRIKKVLSITDIGLESFLQIFKILCAIDGTQFKIKEKSFKEARLQIYYCPWWENLKRSNRDKLIRCDIIDKKVFPEWAKSFNPKIEFNLVKSLPNGNDICELVLLLKD